MSSFWQRLMELGRLRFDRSNYSNCGIDAVSLYPTYRKPFDLIFQKSKTE
jgi:hypothetical protein